MEQKKLLWVIFSAVGFVLVVAVVGLVLFWDNEKNKADDGNKIVSGVVRDFDPVEWVQKNGGYPGIEDPADAGEDVILVYGDSEDQSESSDTSEEGTDEGAGKADEDDAGADRGKDDVEIVVYQPEEQKSVPEPKQEAESSVPKPQAAPKKMKEFWIQAGSYSSMVRADEVKHKLSEKGVASIITTKTVEDTDYYRVRIGPYGSKDEADKFLGWIRDVRGFESSYVSMVYVNRN